jgi:two-component system, cell cycle sensor histidine kinase and response regulator CckA
MPAENVLTVPPGMRVLLIDDQALVAQTIGAQLQDEGFTVDITYDGLSAAEILTKAEHSYDAVITDQNMPGLTGEQLVRNLRAKRFNRPIILLSGYVRTWDEPTFLEAGVNRILTKPAKIQDLVKAIMELSLANPLQR